MARKVTTIRKLSENVNEFLVDMSKISNIYKLDIRIRQSDEITNYLRILERGKLVIEAKKMVYGNAIEYYRKKKGYSMRMLATKLGQRSYNSVARWERGEFMPDIFYMDKLCTVLGVTFEQLFPPPLHNSELKLKHKDEMIKVLTDAGKEKDRQISELQERLYPTDYEVSDKNSNEFADEFEIPE